MDFEYVRRFGYASWQVIPMFFITYIGIAMIFSGAGELAWYSYFQVYHRDGQYKHYMRTQALTVTISGACLICVAILYSIVACIIVPLMRKRRQRAREHPVRIQEPESVSVEGEIKTWFPSSSSDVQEVHESLYTLQQRYCTL